MSEEPIYGYIPSLDGLRAVSILLVIYSHLSVTHVIPHAFRASTLGSSAVIMFFVLSGFLITLQLKSELNRKGTIRLRRFYIRRFFRLMPALLLVIAVAVGMARFGLVPLAWMDVLTGVTYTADYYHPKYWTLAHLWSLSVEEQFYVVWPFLLLLGGVRKARNFALAAILLSPLLRLIGWYGGMDEALVFRRFEMTIDSLAFGCVLAIHTRRFRNSAVWNYVRPSLAVIVCFAGILVASFAHRIWPVSEVFGRSLVSLFAVLIVGTISFHPQCKAAAILAWRPLVWLGKISYSLYLWQQIFLVPTPGVSVTPLPFPANLFAAFALSATSYYFYEAPIRGWSRRISKFSESFSRPSSSEAAIEAERVEV